MTRPYNVVNIVVNYSALKKTFILDNRINYELWRGIVWIIVPLYNSGFLCWSQVGYIFEILYRPHGKCLFVNSRSLISDEEEKGREREGEKKMQKSATVVLLNRKRKSPARCTLHIRRARCRSWQSYKSRDRRCLQQIYFLSSDALNFTLLMAPHLNVKDPRNFVSHARRVFAPSAPAAVRDLLRIIMETVGSELYRATSKAASSVSAIPRFADEDGEIDRAGDSRGESREIE